MRQCNAASKWHDKNLSFGQLVPRFQTSDFFFSLTCRSTCGLGERLINPQADMHQLFVDHAWQDRAIREQVYLCWCITPQLLLSLRLGLWPSKSGRSKKVAKWGGGGRTFWWLSQTRELKMGVSDPTLCIKWRYPPKRVIFVMVGAIHVEHGLRKFTQWGYLGKKSLFFSR